MSLTEILILIQFVYAAVVFVFLWFVSAPYGRHFRKGWGLTLPSWLAWSVMESPSFFVILGFFLVNVSRASPSAVCLFLLWEAHYLYRTFVYPWIIKEHRRRFPVVLVLMAIVFNTLNATVNGSWLFAQWSRGPEWFSDVRFIVGIVLFVAGFVIHAWSDRILRTLRKDSSDTAYRIPTTGLFRFISSPNYFGEILEWAGFALASWSWAGLSFAVFTIANLAPRARSNHLWYKKTFAGYPKDRKALIPFVF